MLQTLVKRPFYSCARCSEISLFHQCCDRPVRAAVLLGYRVLRPRIQLLVAKPQMGAKLCKGAGVAQTGMETGGYCCLFTASAEQLPVRSSSRCKNSMLLRR